MANSNKSTANRITVIFVMVILCGIAIFGQTIRLKVVDADKYRKMVKENSQHKVRIEAVRGDILARDGRKLACSVPNYRITMDPCADGLPDSVFNKNISLLSVQLANFFKDKSPEAYRAQIEKARIRGQRYLVLGNRRISHTELKRVKQFAIFNRGQNKGGFLVEQSDQRKMPFGLLAARTIGKLYSDKALGGMVGLENSYDKVLRGVDGVGNRMRVTGKWIRQEEKAPQNGRSLVTTIDVDIQDVAEYSLLNQLRTQEADHGVAILMEVKTGAIRAIVNLHRQADGSYAEVYNYAIGERSEPGSTFKLATLMACLEDGYVTLDDTIDTYNGEFQIYDQVMRDSKIGGHGNITIRRAFEVSSNIAFSRLVMKYYSDDKQAFIDRMHDLGLCDSLELDIRGERSTMLKNADDPTWSGTTLPWMSIGYEMGITPLQLLTFYNAVANNGTMMRPMFVECQLENGVRVNEQRPHVMRNSIATKKTIRTVQEALKGVVENGTARNIKDTPYKIAGKTGTAQVAHDSNGYLKNGEKRYLASFAGYFPADDPLYSCVVMVYGPSNKVYYGNVVAGTVVKAIADRVYAAEFRKGSGKVSPIIPSSGIMPYSKGGYAADLLNAFHEIGVPNNFVGSADWVSAKAGDKGVKVSGRHFPSGIVPDVRGMGAADAVSLLEELGFRVSLSGMGRVVTQSPAPGARYSKGSAISISLDY